MNLSMANLTEERAEKIDEAVPEFTQKVSELAQESEMTVEDFLITLHVMTAGIMSAGLGGDRLAKIATNSSLMFEAWSVIGDPEPPVGADDDDDDPDTAVAMPQVDNPVEYLAAA